MTEDHIADAEIASVQRLADDKGWTVPASEAQVMVDKAMPRKQSLWDIGLDVLAMDDLLDESGGELTPEVEAAWLAMQAELQHDEGRKLDGMVNWIRKLECEAAACEVEAEAYRAKSKSRLNRAVWIKGRLKDYLLLTGRQKVETATHRKLSIAANGGLTPIKWAEVIDPAAIPEDLRRVKIEPDADKVRKALETGVEVPFASLGVRGTNLRIK